MANDMEVNLQSAIDSGKINGVVTCVTDAAGNFVYSTALGQRTLLSGEKIPQELDDVIFLGSATKLIATIAALQCVDDGLLTLRGNVSDIAPELTGKDVINGFAEDGKTPLLEKQSHPITVEQLVTHSSGIAYPFAVAKVQAWLDKCAPPRSEEPQRVEERNIYPLSYQPGQGWMYGTGLDWAGVLVERVTGGTLLEHIQRRIYDPLDITAGEFYPVTREDMKAKQVDRNPSDPDGTAAAVTGGDATMNRRSKGHWGGHGLFMTCEGYAKVLHSLLANDGKLLKPATVEDMFVHHLSPEATTSHQVELKKPPMGPFFRNGLPEGSKVGYGLGGLLALEDHPGWFGKDTMTWGGGLTSTWFIDRQNDLCGFTAIQSAMPVDVGLVTDLKQQFRRGIYQMREAWKAQQQHPR